LRVLAKTDEIGDAKILRKSRKMRKGLEDLRKMTIFAPMKSGYLKLIFRKSPIGDKLANHLRTFEVDNCR